MKHAKLSPSASHRWLVCPGSVEANATKGHESNVYALEGTSAHGLLEVCLVLGADPVSYLGAVLAPGHMPVDEGMADGVGYALDWIAAYVADNPRAKVLTEHTVRYGKAIGCADDLAFGTSDVIIDNHPKELVALDYKHGIGISVSVKDNSQLLLYLAGKRQERGRYQRYRKVVVQPRVPKRKPVQEASVTDVALTTWLEKEVKPVVPIALGKNAPRVAGSHCRYCHADGKCPAQFEAVQRAAQKEFKVADPKRLTPAQIAKALDLMAALAPIMESIKKHAVEQVHAGVTIPGYEKDYTNGQRSWTDEEKANDTLARLGLEKRERFAVALLSPAQAEKALRAKGKWPTKPRGAAAADFVASPLDAVLTKSSGNPTIRKAQ